MTIDELKQKCQRLAEAIAKPNIRYRQSIRVFVYHEPEEEEYQAGAVADLEFGRDVAWSSRESTDEKALRDLHAKLFEHAEKLRDELEKVLEEDGTWNA